MESCGDERMVNLSASGGKFKSGLLCECLGSTNERWLKRWVGYGKVVEFQAEDIVCAAEDLTRFNICRYLLRQTWKKRSGARGIEIYPVTILNLDYCSIIVWILIYLKHQSAWLVSGPSHSILYQYIRLLFLSRNSPHISIQIPNINKKKI